MPWFNAYDNSFDSFNFLEACLAIDKGFEFMAGTTITNLPDVTEALVNHCITAAERIRSEGLIAKSLYVFIKTSRFKSNYISRVQQVDLLSYDGGRPALVL